MRTSVESEVSSRANDGEGSFGYLVRQISNLHKDLLAFQAKTEQRLASLEGRLDNTDGGLHKTDCGLRKMDRTLDAIERELRGLRADVPKIVRKALSETGRRPRPKESVTF
jgi:hypothetical protein